MNGVGADLGSMEVLCVARMQLRTTWSELIT